MSEDEAVTAAAVDMLAAQVGVLSRRLTTQAGKDALWGRAADLILIRMRLGNLLKLSGAIGEEKEVA